MLTTNDNQALNFYAPSNEDSTVYINPGVAKVGPYIMDFRGGNQTFHKMVNFTGSNQFQYSVMCLENSFNFADLTSVTFTPVDSTTKLISPYVDSTNLRPLGLFLFYTDGTHTTLTSASRIQ